LLPAHNGLVLVTGAIMPDYKSLSKNAVALAIVHSRCRVRSLSPAATSEALGVVRAALDRAVSGGSVHACVGVLLDRTRRQALFKEVLAEISLQLASASESSADGSAGMPDARHSFSRAAAESAMAEVLLQCTQRAADDAAIKCVPLLKAAVLAKPPQGFKSDEQPGVATAADKAIFTAAVCVGRWGELLTVLAEAEGAAHAANEALKAARGLAARAAETIGAIRV
jgi:hypothetical protein